MEITEVAVQGTDGVLFTAMAAGAACRYLVTREALEDVEYALLEDGPALLAAFERQRPAVARAAAAATAGAQPVVLQSLLA